jgi:hypothetical protein
MLRDEGNDWLRRGIADFAMAMVVFWAVTFYVHGAHNRAHAIAAPRIGQETIRRAAIPAPASWQAWSGNEQAAPRTRRGDLDQRQALALLSVAFASIVALNLAFWRHLRRVYASPRRNVWRRGQQT